LIEDAELHRTTLFEAALFIPRMFETRAAVPSFVARNPPRGNAISAAQACGPARAPAASANALAASDFSHRLGRSGLDLTYL
jgi:hypothetical protein